MGLLDTYIRYKVGGWKNPLAYAIFIVVFFVVFTATVMLLDFFFAFVIALITAGGIDYFLFEVRPVQQEQRQQQMQSQAERDAVRQVIQDTVNCMSCVKPLGGDIKCPHCGFDMAPIINKHDD